MSYQDMKATAIRYCPAVDSCNDCGGVLNFFNSGSDEKGTGAIAINKQTGKPVPMAVAIEMDLVSDHAVLLDFETGLPKE